MLLVNSKMIAVTIIAFFVLRGSKEPLYLLVI